MEYRQLGKSEVSVSTIVFGCWAIGGWRWGGQDEKEAIEAIHTAIDLGVTAFDTAPPYGLGRSEEIVGKAIQGRRERIRILTKFGIRWDCEQGELHVETSGSDGNKVRLMKNSKPDSVIFECEQSLRRLKTDRIDLFQCHIPDPTTPLEDTFEAVKKLIKQGKVLAVGVSNFSVEQMSKVQAIVPLASNQPRYNILDRKIEQDILPYCRENGVSTLAYSPLASGLLTGKYPESYEFSSGDHRAESRFLQSYDRCRVDSLLERLRPLAKNQGATLSQLAIAWILHQPGITAVLVGTRTPRQATENVAVAALSLSGKELRRIDLLSA